MTVIVLERESIFKDTRELTPSEPTLTSARKSTPKSKSPPLLPPLLPSHISQAEREVGDVELWPLKKNFSRQHGNWRRRIVGRIATKSPLFPAVSPDTSVNALRLLVDEEAARQGVLARILEMTYNSPDLGNRTDPVDELVYIMLSRRTLEGAYQAAFVNLKKTFASWDDLIAAPVETIEAIVSSGGPGNYKASDIPGALLAIHERFGRVSLDELQLWPDDQIETFLTGLPGVGRKTAYCVMMYSLNRAAFPVDAHAGRALMRLGLFREAGLRLSSMSGDHKKLQAVLADLVPPELRYSLHVNLVAHGRAICRPTKPKCESCPVNRLCAYYRDQRVKTEEGSDRPTVVDMFCGAGGLSEGFRQAGLRTVLAVDSNPVAVRTYRLNHPEVRDEHVICQDLSDFRADAENIRNLLGDQQIDVLVGGPPCQGFSRAGWRSRGPGQRFTATEDDRNFLYRELVGLLEVLRPRIIVMENVPGIGEVAFEDGTTFLQATREAMERQGYQTTVWLLNAAAYGVPQHRVRKIVVGTRDGPPPVLPPPGYRASAQGYREHSRSDDETLPVAITLSEAIADLPAVPAGGGQWIDQRDPGTPPPASRLLDDPASQILHPLGLIFSHVSRFHNAEDLERYAELRPGDNYLRLLERRPDLFNYSTNSFEDKYFRLIADQPAKTIVAHLKKDGNSYIHPFQTRSLTVREAARLQSFPDTYIFTGSRSDQFVQIGNAVPPLLARAVAGQLVVFLRQTPRGEALEQDDEAPEQDGEILRG